MNTFGSRLYQIRKEKKISQAELAEACNVSSSTVVSSWERELYNPDLDKLNLICYKLGVSPNYLLGYRGECKTRELSLKEEDFLNKFNKLDERGQRIVMAIIDEELKYQAEGDVLNKEKKPFKYYSTADFLLI